MADMTVEQMAMRANQVTDEVEARGPQRFSASVALSGLNGANGSAQSCREHLGTAAATHVLVHHPPPQGTNL